MNKKTLQNYYPGSSGVSFPSEKTTELSQDPDVALKQLYRENANLRVRNEILEQSLREVNSGLLSDEKLLKDYQELKAKVESQQRLIDQQNEMLDEAQVLMQQLKEERDTLEEQVNQQPSDYLAQLQAAKEREISANKVIGILQQQLEESQSTLLPPVPEVSDEEDNYSTIHEEIDLITRWLDKIDGLLFESVSKSDEIQTLESRMDRLFDWCQQHQRKSIEVKSQPSVIDSPYFTLLQREIAELEELVEGSNSKGAPVKQLHSLQNTVRSVLEQSGIRSLAELKHSEQDDHRKYDEQMTLLEAPIRAFAKELSIHFTGTSLESQLVQCLDVARELIAGSKQQIGAEEEIRRLNSIIVDKTKALDVVNSLNDRLMELVKSEKKEFENLLFVYKQLEKKYEEARQRSCPSCSDLQKKYNELKESYRASLEEIRSRDLLLQQCQHLVAGKSMRFVV